MRPLLATLLMLLLLILAATAQAATYPFSVADKTSKATDYTATGTFTAQGEVQTIHFDSVDMYIDGEVSWGFDDTTFEDVGTTHSPFTIIDREGDEYIAQAAWHYARPLGLRITFYTSIERDIGFGLKTYSFAFTNTFVTYPLGDIDVDGDVDGRDFMRIQKAIPLHPYLPDWKAQYGTIHATAAVQAVPEPSTLWLLVGGLLGIRWRV